MLIVIGLIALAALARLLYAAAMLWRSVPRRNEDFALLFDARPAQSAAGAAVQDAAELIYDLREARHG